jgi:dihydrofolate reductase
MPIFHAIAAMSENRVIGNQGKIPWHLPEDFRWFKHKTMGGTLIMGRKTFESIGKPLAGRKTVVFTHGQRNPIGGVIYSDDGTIDQMLERLPQPSWICGGGEIYTRFVPVSQMLFLTRVKLTVQGDAFFPPFEDKFVLNQIIFENAQFRVERWFNKKLNDPDKYPTEAWPFG